MFGKDTNTRTAFGQIVLNYAREHEDVVFVGGDSIGSMGLTAMEKEMPERAINMGIAEQDTMGVAAGMAATGYKVVVGGFAPFVTMRAIEQFRTFIAYPNLDVMVAGGMGGMSASTEGVTHQGLEDYGIMRMIPNTVVAIPCDAESTGAIVQALLEHKGPSYVRLGKMPFKKVYNEGEFKFEIGKANLMRDGSDAAIIACGAVIPNALLAAEALDKEGIHVRVINMASIKPIDKQAIIDAANQTGAIVTVEDHQINGGLGSAVAEVLVENAPVPMKRLAIPDCFTQSGEHYALIDHYGMSVEDIIAAVRETIAKK